MPPAPANLKCALARKRHGRAVRRGDAPKGKRDYRVQNACLSDARRKLDALRRKNRRLFRARGIAIDGLHIHHRNGDPTDNRASNLVAIDPAEHREIHRTQGRKLRLSQGGPRA